MAELKIKPLTAGWMLAILYLIGFVGFLIPQTRMLVQQLIWGNVLLTFIILMIYHKKWTKEFIITGLLVSFCGFLINVLGVKTGYIFGYFQYGPLLGYSFLDTPLITLVTWLTAMYVSRQIAELVAKDTLLVSILAALLMVLLNYFIEPFANNNYLWHWNRGFASIHNYLGWFIASLILQYLFIKAIKYPPNKLALPIYFIQLGFFMLYFFILR